MSNKDIHLEQEKFATLILPLAIPKLLTYRIPAHLSAIIQRGSRVIVALGEKKIWTAFVYAIHQTAPTFAVKDIIDMLDETPILNSQQLLFFDWIAQYYMCTLGEVVKAALPSGFRLSSESKIYLHPTFDSNNIVLSPFEKLLVTTLEKGKSLAYNKLAQFIPEKEVYKTVKNLINKSAIILLETLAEKYLPKKERQVRLNSKFIDNAAALKALFKALEKKEKQLEVLLQYMSYMPTKAAKDANGHFISKKQLLQAGINVSALQTLLKKQILIEKEVVVSRLETVETIEQPTFGTLSLAQQQALSAIHTNFSHHNTVLLYGVTGSGKTEIYTQLIQEAMQRHEQVLYLLPEIGLATQIVGRLQKKFGDRMGVYHSKYADNQRVEIWNKVLQNKVDLVVGVRSALLLPFSHLKLIIVDEEHEMAYKQTDSAPRYQARDAALMLARFHQAKVLLGSATPSIESYYNAQNGKYGLVKLMERFGQTRLPSICLINQRIEQQRRKVQGEFTTVLLEAIDNALKQQEQIIIFQNRRGYAAYLVCQACAWVPTCQQCSVSLTYHQFKDYLVCHYCGYHCKVPPVCQLCNAPSLKNVGFGTEKIEETLQYFFPDKQVQRMDIDTTRRKHSYEKIIANLENGHTNILVGTQMITKGLDFAQVSLVGVLDVDRLLYFPDFRSNERCFQLLAQVSGRAGRREKQGQVFIQTTNPDNAILTDIVNYDYEQMYARELLERQKFRYPPYVRLIRIMCQHTSEQLVQELAQQLVLQLYHFLDKEAILGPQSPLIAKVKHQYRMNVWIKLTKVTDKALLAIKQHINKVTDNLLRKKNFRQIKISFDVDPNQ